MSEPELTPWFPRKMKPSMAGVYNVSCQSTDQSGNWYSYFDGRRFHYYSATPDLAFRCRRETGAGPSTQSWRGLASDPKAKA